MNSIKDAPAQAANSDEGKKLISYKVQIPPEALQVNNTADAQRSRLLDALRRESLTTLEARRKLDVLHPAARIMELRRQGFNIVTVWATDLTSEGKPHRVARYILRQTEVGRGK